MQAKPEPKAEELVKFMKAECRHKFDAFYEHADPLVQMMRDMAVKILKSNGGSEHD